MHRIVEAHINSQNSVLNAAQDTAKRPVSDCPTCNYANNYYGDQVCTKSAKK